MVKLSPRETQVLALYDRGLAYKEIAAALRISVHTVKAYCHRIVLKSSATSLRHAAFIRRTAPLDNPSTLR